MGAGNAVRGNGLTLALGNNEWGHVSPSVLLSSHVKTKYIYKCTSTQVGRYGWCTIQERALRIIIVLCYLWQLIFVRDGETVSIDFFFRQSEADRQVFEEKCAPVWWRGTIFKWLF